MRWTSATSFDTEAVGVPSGMRQKSAMHDGGVFKSERTPVDAIVTVGVWIDE